jgi:hypothetical protein
LKEGKKLRENKEEGKKRNLKKLAKETNLLLAVYLTKTASVV